MRRKWQKLFQSLSVSYFLWMCFKKFMFLFMFSSRCEIWAFLKIFDVISKTRWARLMLLTACIWWMTLWNFELCLSFHEIQDSYICTETMIFSTLRIKLSHILCTFSQNQHHVNVILFMWCKIASWWCKKQIDK